MFVWCYHVITHVRYQNAQLDYHYRNPQKSHATYPLGHFVWHYIQRNSMLDIKMFVLITSIGNRKLQKYHVTYPMGHPVWNYIQIQTSLRIRHQNVSLGDFYRKLRKPHVTYRIRHPAWSYIQISPNIGYQNDLMTISFGEISYYVPTGTPCIHTSVYTYKYTYILKLNFQEMK